MIKIYKKPLETNQPANRRLIFYKKTNFATFYIGIDYSNNRLYINYVNSKNINIKHFTFKSHFDLFLLLKSV